MAGAGPRIKQTEPWIPGRENAGIIRPFGNDMKVMLPAPRTDSPCSVPFAEVKPGEGAPPHPHRGCDEYLFAAEGTISLLVDGKENTIVPGGLASTPRDAMNLFENIGAPIAIMLERAVPEGNEPDFRAASDIGTNADPKRLAEINAPFATELIGSSLRNASGA